MDVVFVAAYGRAEVLFYLPTIAYLSHAWTLGTTTLSTLKFWTICEHYVNSVFIIFWVISF